MSDGGFCHDEAEPEEPCDGNGECFRLSADISRLEAENARLRELEGDAVTLRGYIARYGETPMMTHSRAEAAESKLSALIASVREIAEKARKWQTPKGPCAEFVKDPGWNECKECGFDHAEHVVAANSRRAPAGHRRQVD